ncbi:hypothetical protein DFP72DRAFT_1063835 [Ephemerocybe angulata]|uniref:Uncharacterized protein n=1 Tax=Ephemerocybe angulata TaxID=980116 RepID=A0A8H6MCX5_9AGAR|nr:hypothetical protein DFP72DRAFT_1063835 [Tulosesus angulatus]
MGRPRLYHTPEQVAEANRNKSNKYYAKNQKRILRRRAKAKAASKPRTSKDKTPIAAEPQRTAEEEREWQTRFFAKKVEGLRTQVIELLGDKTAGSFLTSVCEKFKAERKVDLTQAKDAINEHSIEFGKVDNKLQKCGAQLLNLVGAWADEFKRASLLQTDVRTLITEVNELMCVAMVDPDQFLQDFDSHSLQFQKDGVVISTLY